MNKNIIIIGAGVVGVFAATKLIENGYPGNLITIIDKGKDPEKGARVIDRSLKNKEDTDIPIIHSALKK